MNLRQVCTSWALRIQGSSAWACGNRLGLDSTSGTDIRQTLKPDNQRSSRSIRLDTLSDNDYVCTFLNHAVTEVQSTGEYHVKIKNPRAMARVFFMLGARSGTFTAAECWPPACPSGWS